MDDGALPEIGGGMMNWLKLFRRSRAAEATDAADPAVEPVSDSQVTKEHVAAKAEADFIRNVKESLPPEFILDGVRVVVLSEVLGTELVSADGCVVISTYHGYYGGVSMEIYSPEIWAVLRPRLQQVADDRKAAHKAEQAAKQADILAKLGGK